MNKPFAVFALAIPAIALLCASCSSAPRKPTVPSLTPDTAYSLLHYDNRAQNWMTYVGKHNSGCTYLLQFPDQATHPNTIDLDHIVNCGGRPAPTEYQASVSFEYDAGQQRWVIKRFSD